MQSSDATTRKPGSEIACVELYGKQQDSRPCLGNYEMLKLNYKWRIIVESR